MELFDLINQNDELEGKTNKTESHKKGLLHRVVAVFVFDAQGNLLVQKRSDNGKLDHSIGGHVSAGETYEQAVSREAMEELLISEKVDFVAKFLADQFFTGKSILHMFSLFEYQLPIDWVFSPTDEVKTLIPTPLIEVIKEMNESPWKFTGGFILTMNEYLKHRRIEVKKILNLKNIKKCYSKK